MESWHDFFLGELGAAAALAGLLFVSMSVNQSRILEFDRMADRGIEVLSILVLVIAISSLGLAPSQPTWLFGLEVVVLAAALLIRLLPLQRSYLSILQREYRPRAQAMAWGVRLALLLAITSGILLVAVNQTWPMFLLVPTILGAFVASIVSAWVLLVEINR